MLQSVEPGSRLTLEVMGDDDLAHLLVATVTAGEDRKLVVESDDPWFGKLNIGEGQEVIARWRGDGRNEASRMRLLDHGPEDESRLLLGESLATADTDHRRHPRLKEKRIMLWGDIELGALMPGTTLDVSKGGLRFHTSSEAPEVGTGVELEIMFPDGVSELHGVVVGAGPRLGGSLLRVEFDAFNGSDLEALIDHLHHGMQRALDGQE